jgi:hypothetical protein
MESSVRPKGLKKFLKWIGVHLHFHPEFYKGLAFSAAGVPAFLIGLPYSSASPSSCNSCHIVEPYYEAWKASRQNRVACVEFPDPPQTHAAIWVKFQSIHSVVQFVTRKHSSKPYAQIEDANCLRSGCHATNILAAKITYKERIRFDHRFHLGDLRPGKQLRCTSCHSQIVVGTPIEVTDSTCYLCPFKHAEGERGPLPPLPEQSPLKGGDCARIGHAKARVKLPQETSLQGMKLPRTRHAFDFGPGCTPCHSAEKHKEGNISKEDCRGCHHKPGNTQCSRCHQEPFALYTAQNLPVEVKEAKASGMAGKVECVGCHDLSKKQTWENICLACTQCHDKAYVEMLRAWREETLEALKKTKDSLDQSNKKLIAARKETIELREATLELERAQKAYGFIIKAKGAHNADLAGAILEQAQKDAQKAGELLSTPRESKGD